MTTPNDFELVNALSMLEAKELNDALMTALDAMAHFGSGDEEMTIIGQLLIVAVRQRASAFEAHETEKSAKEGGRA